MINKALFVKALAKEHTCLTFTGSQWAMLQVYLTPPTILSLISIGSNEKMTIQNVSGHKHKGHMQSGIFYTFPRPIMEDQNHNKTIQCGQCINTCGCPDHQSNMEMIIKKNCQDMQNMS